jgi:hypothetical protein
VQASALIPTPLEVMPNRHSKGLSISFGTHVRHLESRRVDAIS